MPFFRKIVFAGAGMLVGIVAVALGILLWMSPGTTTPFLDARGAVVSGSVAEIAEVQLGGLPQFVLMRGRDTANPVLLLLHGGPGDPHAAFFGYYDAALEEDFVVVHWDQRGAGRSYSDSIPEETMTVDQLITDAHELTAYLKTRFSKRKILLAGHSWGAYLGLRIVDRFPDDYWAYVGIGQVANQQRSEARSYRAILDHARAIGHEQAIEELEALGPPERGRYRGGMDGLGRQRKWVREFGGAAHGKNNLQSLWLLAGPLLTFREYSLGDKIAYLRGEEFSMSHLEEPMLDDDLTMRIRKIDVPLFIFQGRFDLQTDFETTVAYYEQIRAPRKELIVFEESAHLVPFEEPEKFMRVLVDRVRPLARD